MMGGGGEVVADAPAIAAAPCDPTPVLCGQRRRLSFADLEVAALVLPFRA